MIMELSLEEEKAMRCLRKVYSDGQLLKLSIKSDECKQLDYAELRILFRNGQPFAILIAKSESLRKL